MFPAYSSNQSTKLTEDLSWLRCASYLGPGQGAKDKVESDSSNTDDGLIEAIGRHKAQDQAQDSGTKCVTGSSTNESQTSSDDEREYRHKKRSRKKNKKHKKKNKKKDSKRDCRREHSSSCEHKKKTSKRKRSCSPFCSQSSATFTSDLRRKWAFLENMGPTTTPFVLDMKGDQSNRAFTQLPHTSAATYSIKKSRLPPRRSKVKRYFKTVMAPPMLTVEVNEKLRALKPSSYISLGDSLLADKDVVGDGGPCWPSVVREHSELAAGCRTDPHNVDLWLKLCDFEKVYVPCSLGQAQVTGAALKKIVMEKQLSVMVDAIMRNPLDLNLRLKKFDLLCSLERQDELAREWDDVLRMSDYSISKQKTKNQIWLKYAQYARSKFHVVAKFSVEEATAGYCRAIDAFRRTRVDDLFLVTLIEDFACFLVQCGHTERAVAIFQALLDFNLSQPEHLVLEQNEEVAKALFEVFWDSGCAKIGEKDHKGWGKESERSTKAPPPESTDSREDELIMADRPINVVWATLETLRQRKHWMPAKVDAEDVERIILFDDVSLCVFRSRDPRCLQKMLESFMRFLANGDSSYMAWNSANDKMAELLKIPFARDEAEGRIEMLWNCYNAGTIFLPQFDWASVLLDQLLRLCPSEKNEAVNFGKKVMQIKANQMNFTLWAKMLLILDATKAREDAMSRGVKLISMACAGLGCFSGDHIYFLASYLRIHLNVNDFLKVDLDEHCQPMPDVKSLLSCWGALILGKKAVLSDVSDEHITCLKNYLVHRCDEYSIEVGVILKLSLETPVAAYAYLCRKASVLSVDAYHQLDIRLHLLVYRHFASSLSDLRSTVELACEKLPTKQEYMVLLALVSYRSPHSWKRCPIPQSDPEYSWFATVLYYLLRAVEFDKWKERAEIAYSGTRIGGLHRAIAQLGEIRQPLFWRLIVWVEMQVGEVDRAKELLLRGLQCCPWSKAMFVDCGLYFDEMLQQVVDTLTEKGLRLRTPLEELTLLLETKNDK